MNKKSDFEFTDKSSVNEVVFRKAATRIVVKRLREKNNFTQAQLAVLSDISRQHISEIETKGVLITYPTEIKLARALNISPDEFGDKLKKEFSLYAARERERENQSLKAAELDKSKKYGK